ncbi:hypothetical protein BDQ12DRAFT_723177 [Crucibulum laeve]|uniref:Uncharacterized protein n=1 Tax=Crucibulum laeve TaxID=68775 RepID=A0A5C3M3T5_9AGAR|nr:hypothetical protein BDQ12DRAFT_723177 [Crucibulum laeve]
MVCVNVKGGVKQMGMVCPLRRDDIQVGKGMSTLQEGGCMGWQGHAHIKRGKDIQMGKGGPTLKEGKIHGWEGVGPCQRKEDTPVGKGRPTLEENTWVGRGMPMSKEVVVTGPRYESSCTIAEEGRKVEEGRGVLALPSSLPSPPPLYLSSFSPYCPPLCPLLLVLSSSSSPPCPGPLILLAPSSPSHPLLHPLCPLLVVLSISSSLFPHCPLLLVLTAVGHLAGHFHQRR